MEDNEMNNSDTENEYVEAGPDTEYQLDDVFIPGIKDFSPFKTRFIEAMKANGITPKQANGLWRTYTDEAIETYKSAVDRKAAMAQQEEESRQENERIERLERTTDNFDGYHPTREEAMALSYDLRKKHIDRIHSKENPYTTIEEERRGLARVEHFERYAAGLESSLDGWLIKYEQSKMENMKALTGDAMLGQSRSSAYGNLPNPNADSGHSGFGRSAESEDKRSATGSNYPDGQG